MTCKKVCPVCGSVYMVKSADLQRGWGKYCSKSCASKKRQQDRNNNGKPILCKSGRDCELCKAYVSKMDETKSHYPNNYEHIIDFCAFGYIHPRHTGKDLQAFSPEERKYIENWRIKNGNK